MSISTLLAKVLLQTTLLSNIMNYAPVIFVEAFFNFDEQQATQDGGGVTSELLSTTNILGIVKFVVTTFVLFEVDKLGRLCECFLLYLHEYFNIVSYSFYCKRLYSVT